MPPKNLRKKITIEDSEEGNVDENDLIRRKKQPISISHSTSLKVEFKDLDFSQEEVCPIIPGSDSPVISGIDDVNINDDEYRFQDQEDSDTEKYAFDEEFSLADQLVSAEEMIKSLENKRQSETIVMQKMLHIEKIIANEESNIANNLHKYEDFLNFLDSLEEFYRLIDEECIEEKISCNISVEPVCDFEELSRHFVDIFKKYPEDFEKLGLRTEFDKIMTRYFPSLTLDMKEIFHS